MILEAPSDNAGMVVQMPDVGCQDVEVPFNPTRILEPKLKDAFRLRTGFYEMRVFPMEHQDTSCFA